MTRLTLLLFLDAFRRDYVARTTYIRALAAQSGVGTMRESFGFLPQAGYFGGLGPSDTGFTNMYCCDPAASPFGIARGLPDDETGARPELRSWIDAEARRRMTPFAALYATSGAIPIPLLPWFAPVEKYPAWDRRIGYRSIFEELTDRGESFFCCGWPETNRLPDHSDRGLVDHTLANVTTTHTLAFLHLQELDPIGHAYGPESAEVHSAIEATDALTATLIDTLSQRFDRLDLVLFSDHGMVSVTGTVDVWSALTSAGLVMGRDVIVFLDSTMARFWFPTNVARTTVIDVLSRLPGRVLDDADYRRLDIEGCDPRNGELIFLARPGRVISPNFFERRNTVRGMHGYEPDCPDNMGIFLVSEHARNEPADLGIVGPTAVYAALRRSLALDRPQEVSSTSQPVPDGAFTRDPDPQARNMIRGHMARIVAEARRIVPQAEAVILTGSFGRDEGGVRRTPSVPLAPVNDYDVLVVSATSSASTVTALNAAGRALAAEFRTDFVHFGLWPDLGPGRTLTLANYDIRYGSRLLWGNPGILEQLPRFAAADLPLFEGLLLLYNRLGGLLTGLGWPHDREHESGRSYLLNQTMKALMALGDWHLIRHRAYDVSYRTRAERFSWLASGLEMTEDQVGAIRRGYLFKLHPDRVAIHDLPHLATRTLRGLIDTIIDATSQVTRRAVGSVDEAALLFADLMSGSPTEIEGDNAFARGQLEDDAIVRVLPLPKAPVRATIYGVFPEIAAARLGDSAAFRRACERLEACLTPPWPRDLSTDNWELVRGRVAHAWLALVH